MLLFYTKSKINLSEKNDKKIKWIYYIILAISIPSIFVSVKIYDSLKNQMILLNDFNTNSYNAKIQELEAMNMSIPNVTVTTIPLKSLKARYYLNNNQYDKALQNLGSTKNSNPYLFFTDFLKSKVYEKKEILIAHITIQKKLFLDCLIILYTQLTL